MVDHKISLLLKRSKLAEEVCKQLCAPGIRPPRLHGLPNIHKEGVLLRPTVSNIGAPTYKLTTYLAGLHSPLVVCCSYHATNSIEFVHTLCSLLVELEDLMFSFDIMFLFTQVPTVVSLTDNNLLKTFWPYLGMSSLLHISPLEANFTSRQMECLWAPPSLLSSLTSLWKTLRRGL